MKKTKEAVRRKKWFSPDGFDRETAIEEVETELRDRYELECIVGVDVARTVGDDWWVEVEGLTVDVEGDDR